MTDLRQIWYLDQSEHQKYFSMLQLNNFVYTNYRLNTVTAINNNLHGTCTYTIMSRPLVK